MAAMPAPGGAAMRRANAQAPTPMPLGLKVSALRLLAELAAKMEADRAPGADQPQLLAGARLEPGAPRPAGLGLVAGGR